MTGIPATDNRGESIGSANDDCLVLIVGTDGRIREQMSGESAFLSPSRASLRNLYLKDVWPSHVAATLRNDMRKCVRSRGTCRLDVRIDSDDRQVHYEILIMPHGRDSALLVCRDMTERKDMERLVRKLAFSDPLTQLPNRASFLNQLGELFSDARLRGTRLAVLRIHLDGFKFINHTFGRAAGNAVVRETAGRLSAALLVSGDDNILPEGCADARLARTEGDEYTLLVNDAPQRECIAALAERLLILLAEPFRHDDNSLQLKACIGIAEFPQDASDVDTLVANAGVALYEAKSGKGGQHKFFSGSAQVRSLSRMDLAEELRWALENDQFSLAFQPCFDTRSDQIVSAEALLRWHHPLRGAVPLAEIIPVIEMNNLSERVGDWVLRSACRAALAYPQLDNLKISLNLSSRQAFAPLLVERVLTLIEEYELPADRMHFEIRETDFARDHQKVENTARALSERGFQVILDDCGAGTLSVQSMVRAGVSNLKISRSLIARLPHDEHSRRCCAAIIAMGRELGINVTANGVENRPQYECLRQLGCHLLQGFLLCHPVDLIELAERLAEHRRRLA